MIEIYLTEEGKKNPWNYFEFAEVGSGKYMGGGGLHKTLVFKWCLIECYTILKALSIFHKLFLRQEKLEKLSKDFFILFLEASYSEGEKNCLISPT